MLKLICSTAIFICFSLNLGLAQWNIVFINNDGINDISFSDAETGVAISNDKIIISNDSGKTWVSDDSYEPVSGKFKAITFPSPDTGYIIGDFIPGALTTYDGAESWDYQYTLPFGSISGNCVYMVNDNFGFLAGDDNYFGATQNGFQSVENGLINFPGVSDATSSWFIDADTGYSGSIAGTCKTVDGGENWTTLDPLVQAEELKFISPQTGFALNLFELFKTENYGSTWTEIPIPVPEFSNFYAFECVGEDTLYVGGGNFLENIVFIMKSIDGGDSWESTTIDPDLISDYTTIMDIFCFDGNNCFATSNNLGYILKTNNGGIDTSQTSIQSHSFDRLFIFPNPAQSQIYLNMSGAEHIYSINTLNCLGEMINLQFDNQKSANISALLPGVYFTQIITDRGKYSQKWVKI